MIAESCAARGQRVRRASAFSDFGVLRVCIVRAGVSETQAERKNAKPVLYRARGVSACAFPQARRTVGKARGGGAVSAGGARPPAGLFFGAPSPARPRFLPSRDGQKTLFRQGGDLTVDKREEKWYHKQKQSAPSPRFPAAPYGSPPDVRRKTRRRAGSTDRLCRTEKGKGSRCISSKSCSVPHR